MSDIDAFRSTAPGHLTAQKVNPVVLATLLTGLAGFLDAAAYVKLNHLYVSFMSGNSTHLGMAIAAGAVSDILMILVVVATFVAGACLGTWVGDRAGTSNVTRVLSVEVVLMFLATALSILGHDTIALVLVALAMGMQNTLHQTIGGADVGKGFITGALFGLGQAVARLSKDNKGLRRAASNLTSWMVFVGGAAIGALTVNGFGLTSCLSAASTLLMVLLLTLSMMREGKDAAPI